MATVLTKDYTKVKLFDGKEVECAGCKSYREMKKRIEVDTDGKYPADQIILLQVGKLSFFSSCWADIDMKEHKLVCSPSRLLPRDETWLESLYNWKLYMGVNEGFCLSSCY